MRDWFLSFILLIITEAALGQTEIDLYSPYDFEPFVIDADRQAGLMFDLQRILNERKDHLYSFKVQVVPRGRLLRMLEKGTACVVPWVAPEWFNDVEKKIYMWTRPLLDDENVILSNINSPVLSLDPVEITGKSTVTVIGHRDKTLDVLIERGIVHSRQASTLRNSVLMVASQRLDFIVSGRMILNYLVKNLGVQSKVSMSPKATKKFQRRILICRQQDPKLLNWLDQQIDALSRDKVWQDLILSTPKS